MQCPPIPPDERKRLEALKSYQVLDTVDASFDDFTLLAAQICKVPIALISLIDEERQWFLAKTGIEVESTDREVSFCGHAILDDPILEVMNATEDARFADNPLVMGDPKIRFYAGAPLRAPGGSRLGTLCVIDRNPRELSQSQKDALAALARQVITQLELKKTLEIARDLKNEQDRYQRKQAELLEDLEEINQELSDFAHMVSHDLKAPLRGICSLTSWISEDYHDFLPKEGHARLDQLRERTQRMSELIDGVLEYSRVSRSQEKTSLIDVKALLEEIFDSLDLQEGKHYTLRSRFPTLEFQPARLKQVFQNLISNAFKHNDNEHPQVSISCRSDEAEWTFSVQDNGAGIDEKHHSRIFQPFQCLNARPENGSTGLGLSIMKKIIETNDGRIALDSVVGQGSTFSFSLPKQQCPSE